MLWDDILTQSNQTHVDPKKLLQEQLQKAVLAAFSHFNVFNHIVFQGGTALRLFYGNPRFSEDLDFVCLPPLSSFDLTEHLYKLPMVLEPQFPFLQTITAQMQKQHNTLQRGILTTTSDDPQQHVRLHIELAMVPSYQNTLRILQFSPLHPAVRVETQTEIFADKLLALGCRTYIKGRDIWDIYYLLTEQKMTPPWELVWQKTNDYQTTASAVHQHLREVKTQLQTEGVKLLSTELRRFLPQTLFSAYQNLFQDIITTVVHMIQDAETEG